MRTYILLWMVLMVNSCSTLGALLPSKPSLEVNAQVGKTNKQNNAMVNLEGSQKNHADTIMNTNLSVPFLILFGLACWCSPSPKSIFKGVGDFILKVSGK